MLSLTPVVPNVAVNASPVAGGGMVEVAEHIACTTRLCAWSSCPIGPSGLLTVGGEMPKHRFIDHGRARSPTSSTARMSSTATTNWPRRQGMSSGYRSVESTEQAHLAARRAVVNRSQRPVAVGPQARPRSTRLGLVRVEGIDLTLTFLRQKREETKRLARIAPVELGMPVIAAPR